MLTWKIITVKNGGIYMEKNYFFRDEYVKK